MFSHLDTYTRPEPQQSALITIDLQNDFCLPGAPAEGEGALKAAQQAALAVNLYRELGLPIFHVIRLYSLEQGAETVDVCRREAVESGTPLLAPDSDGAQPVKSLLPEGIRLDPARLFSGEPQTISNNECILYKPRWGCFHETRLHELLQQRSITTLAITGTWFSNCVRTTIYEATARDYRIVALRDAIAGMYPRGEEDIRKIKCGVCSCNEWAAHLKNR